MDLRDTASEISVTPSPTTSFLIAWKTRACAQTRLAESQNSIESREKVKVWWSAEPIDPPHMVTVWKRWQRNVYLRVLCPICKVYRSDVNTNLTLGWGFWPLCTGNKYARDTFRLFAGGVPHIFLQQRCDSSSWHNIVKQEINWGYRNTLVWTRRAKSCSSPDPVRRLSSAQRADSAEGNHRGSVRRRYLAFLSR